MLCVVGLNTRVSQWCAVGQVWISCMLRERYMCIVGLLRRFSHIVGSGEQFRHVVGLVWQVKQTRGSCVHALYAYCGVWYFGGNSLSLTYSCGLNIFQVPLMIVGRRIH